MTDSPTERVEVARAQGELEAQMIRAALEGSGITSTLAGEAVRTTIGLTVDGIGEVRILVNPEDEERAREVLAQLGTITICPDCKAANPNDAVGCKNCGAVLG